jgi:hypothetical protein
MEGAGEEHRKVGLGLAMMQMRGSTVPVVVYRHVQFGGGAFLGQLWMAADGLRLERRSLDSNPCLHPAYGFYGSAACNS